MRYCIVGAGFSGAVVARSLADEGHHVLVIDERKHIGGNCYTERDAKTGVMTHCYGPHIFHTADERVWNYLRRFSTMTSYVHKVRAVAKGAVYSLPINLLTINQFFGKTMGPTEARAFIEKKAMPIREPRNFEEQALCMFGEELYLAFFRGYTHKQWGLDPAQLPASILKRLPMRFDYDDSYFAHPHQAIPKRGYTELVASILAMPNVEVRLGARFEDINELFAHVVYTGQIDRYFDFKLGRLGYRTLDFEAFRAKGDFQGTAVLNYCDGDVPYTRITEHKHLAPWEKHRFDDTICYREFSRACGPGDIPYYPIRLVDEQRILNRYIELARATAGVSFIGRLGTYRYLDMDVTIGEALNAADQMVKLISAGRMLPAFFVDPS
ncbi:UDP-galactopyranose mutase [Pseudorhodoplanes sp.]|uniref:UDP-galactopyranose mutase n=1 Tax=Pseudorhodoplanes sp. TaxID=1934341 RepID=UPI003D0EF905